MSIFVFCIKMKMWLVWFIHDWQVFQSAFVSDMICEPSHFLEINSEAALRNATSLCKGMSHSANIYYPSVNIDKQECILQDNEALFSCVGGKDNFCRLCPCRNYIPQQSALCKGCERWCCPPWKRGKDIYIMHGIPHFSAGIVYMPEGLILWMCFQWICQNTVCCLVTGWRASWFFSHCVLLIFTSFKRVSCGSRSVPVWPDWYLLCTMEDCALGNVHEWQWPQLASGIVTTIQQCSQNFCQEHSLRKWDRETVAVLSGKSCLQQTYEWSTH